MATSTSLAVSSSYPFFLLKFELLFDGKPIVIKTSKWESADRSDILLHMQSSEPDLSLELSIKLIDELSSILGKHGIGLTRVLYGKKFPLFVIEFHPPVCKSMCCQLPITSSLCPEVSEIIKKHISGSTSSFLFEVRLELYLCSPSEGHTSVPLIFLFSFMISNNFNVGVYMCIEKKVFEFSRLLGSVCASSSKDFVTQVPSKLK